LLKGIWTEKEDGALPFEIPCTEKWKGVVPELDQKHQYHLYLAAGCPFSHSVYLCVVLHKLSNIGVTYLVIGEQGWMFHSNQPDLINQKNQWLHQIYTTNCPEYTGDILVPVLFNVTNKKVESSNYYQIMKFINSLGDTTRLDLIPTNNQFESQETLALSIPTKILTCANATNQTEFDNSLNSFYEIFDPLNQTLSKFRYLISNKVTVPDIIVFCWLIRYEDVFHSLFKNEQILSERRLSSCVWFFV